MNKTRIEKIRIQLHALLDSMEVPPDRFDDLGWLTANLQIRNRHHANFLEAYFLACQLLQEKMNSKDS